MEHVKRGKLKLKTGATLKVASSSSSSLDRKHKKKKKKSKHKKHAGDDSADRDSRDDAEDTEILVNDMTPAQRRHEEHRKKRVRESCISLSASA